MEKIWFVFEKDHHLGPFSSEDIEGLFKDGHLGLDSQLWKESVNDWVSLSEVGEFSHLYSKATPDLTPELPEASETLVEMVDMPEVPAELEEIIQEEEPVIPDTPIEQANPFLQFNEDLESVIIDIPDLPPIKANTLAPSLPRVPKAPLVQEVKEETLDIEQESLVPDLPTPKEVAPEVSMPDLSVAQVEVPAELPPSPIETQEEEFVSEFEESTGDFDLASQVLDVEVNKPQEKAEEVIIENDYEEVEEADLAKEEESSSDDDEFYTVPIKRPMSWLKAPAIIIFASIIILSMYVSLNNHEDDNRFQKLSDENFHSLMALSKKKITKRVRMKLALTSDGSDLWLATNYNNEAILHLTLKSFKGRTLNSEQTTIKGSAILKNGAAHFDRLDLVQGEKLIAGQYMAQVVGVPQGLKAQVANWLSESTIASSLDFVKSSSKKFQYRGSVLLFGGSAREFETKLSKFKKANLEEKINPLRDRLESYKTLKAMVSNLEETYLERLKSIRRGKHIKNFEADFVTQISPMLQELVLGIHKKWKSYIGKDAKKAKAYEDLLEYGKSVGAMGSDMITKTGSSFKVMKKDRNRLRRIFTKRSLELRTQAETKLQSHYDQILYLRSKP